MTDAEPPIPPDVDLRNFLFTPVFRARLFGSSFHARATDSEWRAFLTLWLKSWDQIPAGSLPDDDIELCRLAELGRDLKSWKKLRQGALHEWFRCSDGRLYNSMVAEGVLDAHSKRATAMRKGKAGALKRWGVANATVNAQANAPANAPAISVLMPGDSNRREGNRREGNRREGNRREVRSDARAREPSGADQSDAERWEQFKSFRNAYPAGTYGDNVWQHAERNFRRLIDDGETSDRLVESAASYCAQQQATGSIGTQFIKRPDKFLSAGNWRGPFPKPKSKAQVLQDANVAATQEWLRRPEAPADG